MALALCAQALAGELPQLRGLTDAELFGRVRIHRCSAGDMDALLPELWRRFPAFDDRVRALARLYLGAPYAADPLTDEQADWLPYGETNCTMLVLYIEALANSRSLAEAREHMRLLHYRGGVVGFRTRYHFTEDRITDPANRYFAEATIRYVRKAAALRRVTLELNRTKGGGLLFGGRLGGWTKKVTLAYIPRQGFKPQQLAGLGRVTGVAFVKKANWDKGLIVGHEGLLMGDDLYHASPGRGVVVEKNYLAAGFAASNWEGMVLFDLKPCAMYDKKPKKKGRRSLASPPA